MSSEVKLEASNKSGFLVENRTEHHTWNSDEPIEIGGTDLAAKPRELFLSSLASCILITMRMYANRKQWDLGATSIQMRIAKQGEKTVIIKKIELTGNLSDVERARILDVANRCPVAKMIVNGTEIVEE